MFISNFLTRYACWTFVAIQSCLPENERPLVHIGHVTEAGKQKQQVLLKFWRRCGLNQPPQKGWIIVVSCLGAAFTQSVLQDPKGVYKKLPKRRVKVFFIPNLVEPLHEVSIPLSEMKPVAIVYHPCQRVCAHLQERRTSLWVEC